MSCAATPVSIAGRTAGSAAAPSEPHTMQQISLNPGPCKTWLLVCPRAREAVLVDPVVDYADSYLQALDSRGLRLVRIVDTHTHADHVSAGTLLAGRTGVPYAMHQATPVRTVGERLKDGDVISFGDEKVRVLHTPGHTKDSLSLVGDRVLVTGDFLFLGEGGAGRTDLLGGDPGEHWDSLQKVRSLPDHLAVLPGHDYRGGSTGVLGEERRKNPRLAARTRDEYVRWLSSMRLEPAEWMLSVIKANAHGATERGSLPIPEGGACCEVRGGVSDDVPGVEPAAVAALLRTAATPGSGPVVLDVRELMEFTGPLGRVPGARHLSVRELQDRAGELAALRDRDIYVICLSGSRSAMATEFLRSQGFDRTFNVEGGMKAWAAAGLPREFGPVTSAPV